MHITIAHMNDDYGVYRKHIAYTNQEELCYMYIVTTFKNILLLNAWLDFFFMKNLFVAIDTWY